MRYRVGQEPAFDLKRLLVAACKEAGLEIIGAYMSLMPDKTRAIEIEAAQCSWPFPGTIQVLLATTMEAHGGWPNAVSLIASAPLAKEKDFWLSEVPTVFRDVPVNQIVPAIHETLEQQAAVIAARERGEDGPWVFGDAEWKVLVTE